MNIHLIVLAKEDISYDGLLEKESCLYVYSNLSFNLAAEKLQHELTGNKEVWLFVNHIAIDIDYLKRNSKDHPNEKDGEEEILGIEIYKKAVQLQQEAFLLESKRRKEAEEARFAKMLEQQAENDLKEYNRLKAKLGL